MERRLALHEVLVSILGSRNVYYQPPEGYKMSYPCIVYNRNNIRTTFADDKPYLLQNRYSVTIIDTDPDSGIPEILAKQPKTTFERSFANAGLNHTVFNIYY